jgi:mono/diheme cytochrome c family protein
MRWLLPFLVVFQLPTARATPSQPIEIWTRSPGRYGETLAPARTRVVSVDLDRRALHEGELVDVQYGSVRHPYRFVFVDELINDYHPAADSDVALLHFANGMMIPLRFRDRAQMDRLHPAVARAVRLDGAWTTDLPEVRRTEIGFADARPVRFHGNKLIVAEPWHPDLLPSTEATFTPYRFTDTLVGIEFAVGDAFRAQFDVAPAEHAGLEVYQHVCAFCHGARDVGAQFGWDFVDPMPISEYRKRDISLYYHLRYRAVDAPSRGLLMPALPFLTEKDAANVLAWLRELAARPLNPYMPH